jgi:hypothetical protein
MKYCFSLKFKQGLDADYSYRRGWFNTGREEGEGKTTGQKKTAVSRGKQR